MEALNHKEKIGVTMFCGGVVVMLVGGFAQVFKKQLELTEHQENNMKKTVMAGSITALGGFIYLSVFLGERRKA